MPDRGDPPEHIDARAALLERFALNGLTANVSFKLLVRQMCLPPRYVEDPRAPEGRRNEGGFAATRTEAEEVIRRAEEAIKQEMTTGSQRDLAMSYRRMTKTAGKLDQMIHATPDPKVVAVLAQRQVAVEARLAELRGWNEPERLHVILTNPSERVRKAFEGFDDDDLVALALEEDERTRTLEAARTALGLPSRAPVVVTEGGE